MPSQSSSKSSAKPAAASTDRVRCAIIGGTGYTAVELAQLLLRHPHADIVAMISRSDHRPAAEVHPSLDGRLDLELEDLDAAALAGRAEVAFCCLPHVASMDTVPSLLAEGLKVVDLSADYRLSDPAVYERWYGHVHTDPTRLGETVYGLPELFRDRIRSADLVANPGCYTSTTILALAPLLDAGLIEPSGLIVDAKSGVSGAGRSPKLGTLYTEVNDSIAAYSVGGHRHQPEIDQVLSEVSGQSVRTLFTPHLVPMDRGILATIYATPTDAGRQLDQAGWLRAMRSFYDGEPFVVVTDQLPATKAVTHTNRCRMTARPVPDADRVIVLSTLDNMIKGASGVAVQNFNLMCGFDETAGLE